MHWVCRVLAKGAPGKSPNIVLLACNLGEEFNLFVWGLPRDLFSFYFKYFFNLKLFSDFQPRLSFFSDQHCGGFVLLTESPESLRVPPGENDLVYP